MKARVSALLAAVGVALGFFSGWGLLGSCARNVAVEPPPGALDPVRPPGASEVASTAPAPPASGALDNSRSAIGYNLDFPGDWTGLPPFVDLMKNARAWRGVCSDADPECDAQRHLSLDEHGWVRTLAYRDDPSKAYERVETVVLTREAENGFGGDLVLDYEGQGRIELFNARVVKRDDEHRRITFRAQEGSTFLRVWASDPDGTGDYLKNLRVYRAEHAAELAAGQLFNPDMLGYLAPFGPLRFMDWMESNQHGLCSGGPNHQKECYAETDACPSGRCVLAGRWSERPRMGQFSLLSRSQFLDPKKPGRGVRIGGYPVEMLVALANQVGADPHFNLPAAYEDEYVVEFAKLVKQTLSPRLRVTVEYSNEIWNWGFPQAEYANAMGRRALGDVGSAWVQWAGSRMQKACTLFKRVFSDQPRRVRCLISPQTGWFEMAEAMADCPDWRRKHPELGACHDPADAVAITGYFSGCLQEKHNQPELKKWLKRGGDFALDRFFEQLEHGRLLDCSEDGLDTSLDAAIQLYGDFAGLARARNLELYVYESGTHFNYDGDDPAIRQLLVAATRDPRMGELYRKNLDAYRAAGGTIFNVWGWVAPNDAWSNVERLGDVSHPKYRALTNFVREVPCWWQGCERRAGRFAR